MDREVAHILDKSVAGERITPAEGLGLLESHDLKSCNRSIAPLSSGWMASETPNRGTYKNGREIPNSTET